MAVCVCTRLRLCMDLFAILRHEAAFGCACKRFARLCAHAVVRACATSPFFSTCG